MKQMRCPLNGVRNIAEFVYGGPVTAEPDAASCSDTAWTDHLFKEPNGAGVIREWWCHAATGYWFVAERHAATDEILRTYPATELPASSGQGGGL